MGQKADFPYESIERFRGNLSSTDNSTANPDGTVNDSPHCGDEAALLCVPKEKFIADMPSQGLASVQLPAWDQLGSENIRRRSDSIPIKINTAVADDSDGSRDTTCMCRYDFATWQMYNRIVVHRLNCPVNLSQKVAPGESRQASDDATLHRSSCEMVGHMPIPESHDYLEGEVMELELGSCEMVDPMPVPDSNHYLEGGVFELEL
jgi:hypothetical protein